jgi:Ca2+-binding EF-hand superfamily protein
MNEHRMNVVLSGSLLVLSLSSLAVAGEGANHGGPPGAPGRAAFAAHLFERMDTDKNGQVTRAEAEAEAERLFTRMDANKDGQLTRQESDDGARAIRQQELGTRFRALDTNDDGRLTAEESKLPPRFFERLDADKDHALTLAEFQAVPDFGADRRGFEFEQSDENHDGKVTRAEALHSAQLRFERVDTNHDGVITRAELDARLAEMGKARREHAPADAEKQH